MHTKTKIALGVGKRQRDFLFSARTYSSRFPARLLVPSARPPTRPAAPPLSVIMHVASPGLPESTLRHLFYRVSTPAFQPPPLLSPSSGRMSGGNEPATSPRPHKSGGSGGDGGGRGGDGGGRGGDGGESPPSALRLARAVAEFPLACEGLATLVEATATDVGARNLLRQLAHQAKQALEETEKVR